MTEAQRRYMKARQRVESAIIDPATELLAAASGLVQDYKARAERAEATLEELRPVWAQGFTDDSQAAQANGNALAEIWKLLDVENQTDAMARLRTVMFFFQGEAMETRL